MVLNIGARKSGQDDVVQSDIRGVVEAAHCGGAICKVIFETSLLTIEEKVRAALASKRAGADFVKTSTGFSTGGATAEELPSGALWPVFLPTPAVRQGTPRTHIRNCGNQPAYQSLITDVYKSRLLPCAFTRSITRKGGRENVCRPLEFGHQSARRWTCSGVAVDRRYLG